ncbi:MAG: hypothetical protein HN432_16930, partial [Gammaproteobacteria bacterium]|nr:hypothetical protein [Gammaproteobacteria bacterium]
FSAVLLLMASMMIFGQTPDHTDHTDHTDLASDDSSHSDHGMIIDEDGAVMNQNFNQLPRGCTQISRDQEFTVYAGSRYASAEPGMIFGMSEYEFAVEPCSRVTVTFVNEDDVRHQWMVHGLPKYLYPAGMFHIEASGGRTKTGSFIAPSENQNYLVHCDLAQHMEKGMRAQLVVGSGSGDIWGVSGISDNFYRADYLPGFTFQLLLIFSVAIFGFLVLFMNRARD